jgi:hypothetical protein
MLQSERKGGFKSSHKQMEENMKYFKEFAAVSALLFLLPSAAVSIPSYLIVCRGGGNLYFNYTPFSNFSQSPQVWISFERGAQAVGANWDNRGALTPGQCAWLDRPVSSAEPDRIIVKNVKNFTISWTHGQVMGISSELSYLDTLRKADHYQSFDVYNDGKGNFIVTGIGESSK